MDSKLRKPLVEAKYLNVENTPRYRTIIRFLYLQFEKMKNWSYVEDVYDELKKDRYFDDYTQEQCSQDLTVLYEWGNLECEEDKKNFKTIEDYKNKKHRYQLTRPTIEIERMIITLENIEYKNFSLEPTLMEKIASSIGKLRDMSPEEDKENYFWWENLEKDFETLNHNYRDYIKEIDKTKKLNLFEINEFMIFKTKLVEYLQDFVVALQKNSSIIERYLKELDEEKVRKIFEGIASHGYSIPRPLDYKISEDMYRERVLGRWETIEEWFLGTPTQEAESTKIIDITQNIMRKITNYAVRISEATTNYHNRKEEYKKLASLFYKYEDMEKAHKLSACVFGLEKSFKLKFFIERKTDSIHSSVFDEEPAVIRLISKNKVRKEKQVRSVIEDKTELKRKKKIELLKELEKEKEILDSYIFKNRLEFANLPELDPIIRDKFLTWLFKAFESPDYRGNTEKGRNYKLENITPKETCILRAKDGEMQMPAFVLIFEDEEKL